MPEPMKIKSVDLVPAPGGYFLDILPEGGPLQRFKFHGVSQITAFSSDARRIALMATGYEEHNLKAEDVRQDDLIPSIGGGRVYSRDVEKVEPDEVGDDPTRTIHLTFAGTEAVLSVPPEDGISVLRKIQ